MRVKTLIGYTAKNGSMPIWTTYGELNLCRIIHKRKQDAEKAFTKNNVIKVEVILTELR